MNIIAFLEPLLCLMTLGAIIPALHLGTKISPAARPPFFLVSGFSAGVLFSLADLSQRLGFSCWGFHTWIPSLLNLILLSMIARKSVLPYKKAIKINIFMQTMLISSLPMVNDLFRESHALSQIITYTVLTGCFAFVFYNSYRLLTFNKLELEASGAGTYIYIVLLVLASFEPVTQLPQYYHWMSLISTHTGLWAFGLSFFLQLFILPVLCFIPYAIIKKTIYVK